MFWAYQGVKKVGVGELWGGGARRVVVAHGLYLYRPITGKH